MDKKSKTRNLKEEEQNEVVNREDEYEEAVSKVKRGLTDLSRALNQVAASLRETHSIKVRQISYENCIEYFVENKPPKFARAAILREKLGLLWREYKITQIYLDRNDEVVRDLSGRVYGRVVLADRLDDELDYAFGKYDILIVE